jgi:HD-GYP domain-containing protein (c-di-GMP phosphodiesterase class II)
MNFREHTTKSDEREGWRGNEPIVTFYPAIGSAIMHRQGNRPAARSRQVGFFVTRRNSHISAERAQKTKKESSNGAGGGKIALVAVVDPSAARLAQIDDALATLYRVQSYTDATLALLGLKAARPDVLLIDDSVTPGDGYGFAASLRQNKALSGIPIVMVARGDEDLVRVSCRAVGAEDWLIKPYRRSRLLQCISTILNKKVEEKWDALPEIQKKALKGTVDVFNTISDVIATGEPLPFGTVADACTPLVEAINNNDFKSILNGVKNHDNYSFAHSMRVATLLSLFGHAAGIHGKDQQILASGGLLHDVGKTAIPLDVLNKPGRLDDAELAVMRSHVTHTITYLEACPDVPKPVTIIASQHHEKIDGTGYPNQLKGSQLNELARMAAIVDVFSALTDRRVYKPAMDPEVALNLMSEQMKNHLDQHFLGQFKVMLLDAVL